MDTPEQRVSATLGRISRKGLPDGMTVESLAAADTRSTARTLAERRAADAGRADLVTDARARLGTLLDRSYRDQVAGTMLWSDPSTGEHRAAIAIALSDLLLSAAVDDLVEPAIARTLARDGEALLGQMLSPAAAYKRAGIETGGPIDPAAAPHATAQLALEPYWV